MSRCPYPDCMQEMVSTQIFEICPRCSRMVISCIECGTPNRAFARFCRSCGKPINSKEIEGAFYSAKIKPTNLLSFPEEVYRDDVSFSKPFLLDYLFINYGRALFVSQEGFLYYKDFIRNEKLFSERISENAKISPPVRKFNKVYFGANKVLYEFDLIENKLNYRNVGVGNIVFVSPWEEEFLILSYDTENDSLLGHWFDSKTERLRQFEMRGERAFSINTVKSDKYFLFFTEAAVYKFRKGRENPEIIEGLTKESLNVHGSLFYEERSNVILLPEATNLVLLDLSSRQGRVLVRDLKKGYINLFTSSKIIIGTSTNIIVYDFSGTQKWELEQDLPLSRVTGCNSYGSMKILGDKLLFSVVQTVEGFYPVLIKLIEPIKILFSPAEIKGEVVSNIDITADFMGVILKRNSRKELSIWKF